MILLNKYGQNIDIESLIAQGVKEYEIDGLDIDKVLELKVSSDIKFESFLSGADLKIDFTQNQESVMVLVLKNMGDLLAQNDGDSLVKIIMVNADGEEVVIADMTDFTTAFASTAAAGTNGTATETPVSRFDTTNDRSFGNVSTENVRPDDNPSPFAASADLVGTILTGLEADTKAANVAPQITVDGAFTIDEDNGKTFTISSVDPDGSIADTQPTALHGTTQFNKEDGTITYTPNADYNGKDTITVVVKDNAGGSSTKTIDVTINPINDAPIIDATETVTIQESDLQDLTIGILSVIATNDTNAAGIPVYGFDVDTSNAQVVSLLAKLGENALTKMITDALQAIAFDATGQAIPSSLISVNVDITDTSVSLSANVTGLPLNPFAQVGVLDSIRDTIFDNIGDNFQLPIENGTYQGDLNLVDVDSNNPEHAVTAVNYDPNSLSLVVTSTDSKMIALAEQLSGANASTSFLKELLSDLQENGTPSAQAEVKTVTIDGGQLALLMDSGLFMLEINTDGTYTIASPLFNMMSEKDNIEVHFDYTAIDAGDLTASGKATVTIDGVNDAPIALDSTDDVMIARGEISASENLPGAYSLNTIKDLAATLDTSNGVAGVLDVDALMSAVQDTVVIDIDLDNTDDLVNGLGVYILDHTTNDGYTNLDTTIIDTIEGVLGSPTNEGTTTLAAAAEQFKTDVLTTDLTTVQNTFADQLLGLYETKLSNLETDLTSAVTDTVTDITNEKAVEYTKQSFIDTFGDTTGGKPAITFDETALESAISTLVESDQGTAAQEAFATALSDAINNINETEMTDLAAEIQKLADNETDLTNLANELQKLSDNETDLTNLANELQKLTDNDTDLTTLKDKVTLLGNELQALNDNPANFSDSTISQEAKDLAVDINNGDTTFDAYVQTIPGALGITGDAETIFLYMYNNDLSPAEYVDNLPTMLGITGDAATIFGYMIANDLSPAEYVDNLPTMLGITGDAATIFGYMIDNDLTPEQYVDNLPDMLGVSMESADLFAYFIDNNIDIEDFMVGLTTDALDDAQSDLTADAASIEAEISTAIINEMKTVIEDSLGDLTGDDDTTLTTLITNYVNAELAYQNDNNNPQPDLNTLQANLVDLYIAGPLEESLSDVIDVANVVSTIDTNAIDLSTISAEGMLNEVLAELGLTNINPTTLLGDVVPEAQTALTDFAKEIDVATLLTDTNGVNENLKDLLDTLMGLVSNTIDGVFTKPDGTEITNEVLESTINEVVSNTLDDALDSVMTDLINKLDTDTDVSDNVLDTLRSDVNNYLISAIITDDSISFDVDTMKATALNNMIDQLNLSDFGLLDKTSRDALADDVVDDLYTRLSLDEDITDLADIGYKLVDDSVETIVTDTNGNSVAFTSLSTVTIDTDGSYTVQNDAFSSLDPSYNVQVKFDYQTTNDATLSEAKTTTVNIDLEDHIDVASNADLADLLQSASGLDSVSVDGTHVLSSLDLSDYVAMTDDDNTLKVYGDETDTLTLKSGDWSQVMLQDANGADTTTPYTDGDGFHVYTATSTEDQVIKLLIEDKVAVEI